MANLTAFRIGLFGTIILLVIAALTQGCAAQPAAADTNEIVIDAAVCLETSGPVMGPNGIETRAVSIWIGPQTIFLLPGSSITYSTTADNCLPPPAACLPRPPADGWAFYDCTPDAAPSDPAQCARFAYPAQDPARPAVWACDRPGNGSVILAALSAAGQTP